MPESRWRYTVRWSVKRSDVLWKIKRNRSRNMRSSSFIGPTPLSWSLVARKWIGCSEIGGGERTRTPFEFATIYVEQSVILMLPPCSKKVTWRFRGPIAAFGRLENPGSAATTTRSTVWDVGYKPTTLTSACTLGRESRISADGETRVAILRGAEHLDNS